ncbi:MAG: ATP-binding protein [Bdellovibrionota bacterium]
MPETPPNRWFEFDQDEYRDRFRVVVEVEFVLWIYLVAYHFGSSYVGAREIPPAFDWALIGGYGLHLLLNIWSVARWRFVAFAVYRVSLFDTFAIAAIGWRWGGVETFGPSLALLAIMIAALAVGARYAAWLTFCQTLWLCGVARIDGVPVLRPWFATYGIHAFATLAVTSALAHFIRERERSLRTRGAELEQDRSELRRSVDELSELAQMQIDSLIRSERLAMIGQLAPTIVHDLKNPLGALASVAHSSRELLQQVPAPDEKVKEVTDDLQVMQKQLLRLKDMVQSILNLSRQDEGYSEPVQVNDAARDALETVQLQTKAFKLKIEENLPATLPEVRGNRGQLAQVMVNLLWNAAQAIGEEKPGTVSLATRAENGSIVIDITDSGPGIPADVLPRLFSPFFTTKKVGTGTGLGLYLCREIVRRHRGTIEASGAPGGGARFLVQLPATPQ